ncbi:MAG: adhesin, partial [Oxalobacteraceae bacterium]|nr:adhesin [Oxalobacteraceae bacterium]
VQFHFLLGFGQGFVFIQARNLIRLYLPDAVIYPHQPYSQYLETIGCCDMYINPFPFGNTNGLVDMTHLGLVGVCKSGPEVLEHIDAALFRRLGLPEDLITDTAENYVDAAVKLANDHTRRFALRQELISKNAVERLFEGDVLAFGNQLSRLAKR